MLNLGELPVFDTRSWKERRYFATTMRKPWSGYLGGIHRPGYWVSRLAAEWCSTFKVNHAIPCNSATSGLLAACMAAGIGRDDLVLAPVYTMSATASCAILLGARVKFIDVEAARYSMCPGLVRGHIPVPKAIIVTNLFGHPAYLRELRTWCDENKVIMIEDNAQGIGAMEMDRFAGTIGHIGVFSLNVHKHLQTGEGGVVVTDDAGLAEGVRDAINHGELRKGGRIGLNLRMTEQTASLAVAQLSRMTDIIESRRQLAHDMNAMVINLWPFLASPEEGIGCKSVYYQWAARVWPNKRKVFVERLNAMGLPMRVGYSPLLTDIFMSQDRTPTARAFEDESLITFEICAYNPTRKQRILMKDIFEQAAEDTQ